MVDCRDGGDSSFSASLVCLWASSFNSFLTPITCVLFFFLFPVHSLTQPTDRNFSLLLVFSCYSKTHHSGSLFLFFLNIRLSCHLRHLMIQTFGQGNQPFLSVVYKILWQKYFMHCWNLSPLSFWRISLYLALSLTDTHTSTDLCCISSKINHFIFLFSFSQHSGKIFKKKILLRLLCLIGLLRKGNTLAINEKHILICSQIKWPLWNLKGKGGKREWGRVRLINKRWQKGRRGERENNVTGPIMPQWFY